MGVQGQGKQSLEVQGLRSLALKNCKIYNATRNNVIFKSETRCSLVQGFILKRSSPLFWEPRHSFLSVVTSQALMIAGEKWCNSQVRLNEIND